MRAPRLPVILMLLGPAACAAANDDDEPTPEPPSIWTCDEGDREGSIGESENETASHVDFNVRTPEGYDPVVGSPLIVVYAPAGANEVTSEGFHELTADALDGGYVIAYSDHVGPTGKGAVEYTSHVLDAVVDDWCIDEDRVYFTGHSDGGTVSSLLVIWDLVDPKPAAIAPGGAGLSAEILAQIGCSYEVPVMVTHGANDTLFPGRGEQAARWWAECNDCDEEPTVEGNNDCEVYSGCTDGAEVRYCENELTHPEWPEFMNDEILEFFARFPL
jgi:polyhydroxybutyrate depolymerase